MKKIVATACALAMAGCSVFADTHETYKATSLQTPVGNISFGAWGRSTFEIGQEKTTNKITVDPTALGQAAVAGATTALTAYATAGGTKDVTDSDFATDFSAKLSVAGLGAQGIQDALMAIQGAAILNQLKAMETDTTNKKNYAQLNPDWSYGSRVGFWIIGRTQDEKFGFDFNLDSDARALFVHKLYDGNEAEANVNYNEDGKYAVAIGDQAKIWAVLDCDKLGLSNKIAFGKMRENYLRGSIGDFGQRESSDVKSEDDIFQEFWPTTGLFVSTQGQKDTLLENFYAAGCLDISGTLGQSATDTDITEKALLYDSVRLFQGGVGYTVPGLVQLKAQYWGDHIGADNYRYEESKYASARAAGYDMNDYYGRLEFGIDFLGFMGGANGLADVDLDKTPNANLIELGFKLPLVTRDELREYDPEKFYNWYSCLGTMGVIQKGFILYKGHIWGGQGTSNLAQYSNNIVTLEKGKGADIFMAGFDALAEVCINPFGKQDVFVGLSGNYNITSAKGDDSTFTGLELKQHNIGAEVYLKKTFGSNNYLFAGIADRCTIQSMEGTVGGIADLTYKATNNQVYMPIGIEMFF